MIKPVDEADRKHTEDPSGLDELMETATGRGLRGLVNRLRRRGK